MRGAGGFASGSSQCPMGYATAMADAAPALRMNHDEFVTFLASAEQKHEFLRGEVFAMAGGTPEHARLAMRVGSELMRLLGGRGCEAFSSDLRVRVVETDFDTFPDVTVVSGKLERAPGDTNAVTNPALLVEVLSDSTEAYDRGEKFAHYRRLASLQGYLLVSQREARLELFERREDGSWLFREAGPGQRLTIASLGVELAVDAVFATELAAS